MSKANILTLQDLIEQGYTADQIINLVSSIQAADKKAKEEAEAKRQAEIKAREEAKRKAKIEAAEKNLAAAWFAYCDTVGVGTKPEDMKFRNDLMNLCTSSAKVAGDPSEDTLDHFITTMVNLAGGKKINLF